MKRDSKKFLVKDILSLTTGVTLNVTQDGPQLGGVKALAGHLAGSHTVISQGRCREELLRQHPDLSEVAVYTSFKTFDQLNEWVAVQERCFGKERVVRPMPAQTCGG